MQIFGEKFMRFWKLLVSSSSLYLAVWGIGKLSEDMLKASNSSFGTEMGKVKKSFWD